MSSCGCPQTASLNMINGFPFPMSSFDDPISDAAENEKEIATPSRRQGGEPCPLPLSIATFSKQGHGRGKSVEAVPKTVEIPFSVPGDHYLVMLKRQRAGCYRPIHAELTVPSPLRIAPKCIHFGICGGCRWQQLSYEDQLKIKQKQVEELFMPLLPQGVSVLPIIACEPPWQYRNKMEFTFSSDAAGQKFLGLIMDGSRGRVLNLTECHLVKPWFIDALQAARSWWEESGLQAYHPHRNTGSLRTLTVREGTSSGDRLVMLTVSGKPEDALNRRQLDAFVAALSKAIAPKDPESSLSIFLRIQQAVKGQETQFYEMLLHGPDHLREQLKIAVAESAPPLSLTFHVSPSAFFQPNTRQAERLYSKALQMLALKPKSIVYDLYCGTGTLGICAAHAAASVVGIEISHEAAVDARSNVKLNGLNNVEILRGAVHQVLEELCRRPEWTGPDAVMVDPPRSGLDAVTLGHLEAMRAPKLLYISCNPHSQVDNVAMLMKMGYELKAVQPVDQFPHTVHIENIVLLEMSGPASCRK